MSRPRNGHARTADRGRAGGRRQWATRIATFSCRIAEIVPFETSARGMSITPFFPQRNEMSEVAQVAVRATDAFGNMERGTGVTAGAGVVFVVRRQWRRLGAG